MSEIEKIKNQIINDPENLGFTKKGWSPIFMASENAKIVIIGPAPGQKTQAVGQVFRDKSGEKLRSWLGVSEGEFYNSGDFAVLPLDFYFPGKAKTGDLPPRKDFAQKWHAKILNQMPNVKLIILIGLSSQKFYLKNTAKNTLTETVFSYKEYLPKYFPLVHPSPLNFRWQNKNPDFENKIVPELQKIVHKILQK